MIRPPDGVRPERLAPTLITLIVLSLLLMTLDIRSSGGGLVGTVRGGVQELIGPVQRVLDAVVTPVADFVEGLAGVAGLRDENARLVQQLAVAEAQVASIEELQARLKVLEELHQLQLNTGELLRTPANVIGRVDAFDPTFRISKGGDQGVLVGHPVIDTRGYLVGRVSAVSANYAIVVPLSASDQAVTVSVGDQVGTLEHQLASSRLLLQVFEATGPMKAGTEVVTSAQAVNFPPGVPVGRIAEDARPDGNALVVPVDPYVSVDSLRIVVVLTWPAGDVLPTPEDP